ncbi:MAG: VanZ family protein [Candidatus Competibacteraceae bacterium]|nr:VanZ family protein [Candidatus Competibacteraceae bacterium]
MLSLLINQPEIRFERIAPALIDFPDGNSAIQQRGKLKLEQGAQGLALHIPQSGRGALRWSLSAPRTFDSLRLTGIISVGPVLPQARPGQQARLVLKQPLAEKPHNRLAIRWPGTEHRQHFDRVVNIRAPALPLYIDLALTTLSGRVVLHSLVVDGLTRRVWVESVRGLLLSTWIGLVLWTGWRLMRPVASLPRFLTWTVLGLTLIGILMPPAIRQVLENWLNLLFPLGKEFDSGLDVDTLGHFSLFATIAMLLFWTRADLGWLRLLCLLTALALATELMQLFIDGRQPDQYDVLIDLAGISAGLLLMGAVGQLKESCRGWSALPKV